MTRLVDLFPLELLAEMIADEYIRPFEHRNGDLVGYNYSPKAQADRVWNPATRQCRGLIADTAGNVIARPFPKFFNWGDQPEEDAARLTQPYRLYEKLDGSLGIHYAWNGEEAIATRGSFHGDQAEWATYRLHHQGRPEVDPSKITLLFEIIYPANRIVVDYGDRSELVLIDAIEIETGGSVGESVASTWPRQPTAASYAAPPSLDQVKDHFADTDDGNFEGVVARWEDGHRVKIKLDEYLRLHRIMSSTSNRTVWEALAAGSGLAQMMESVPDEFMDWVQATAADFNRRYDELLHEAELVHARLAAEAGADRKTFALAAKGHPLAPLLFRLLDGKDVAPVIWKWLWPQELEYPPVGRVRGGSSRG